MSAPVAPAPGGERSVASVSGATYTLGGSVHAGGGAAGADPLAASAAPPGLGASALGGGGLATFGDDDYDLGNFRLGAAAPEPSVHDRSVSAAAPAADGLAVTLDKAAIARVKEEAAQRARDAAAAAGQPRRARCAALDAVAARDAYAVTASLLLDEVDARLGAGGRPPPAADCRRQALALWRRVAAGAEPTTLQAVAEAVRPAAAALAQLTGAAPAAPHLVAAYRSLDPGDRGYMEDFAVAHPTWAAPAIVFADPAAAAPGDQASAGDCYFAAIDGHGGVEAAEWASQRLHHRIFAHPQYSDATDRALTEAFADVDGAFAAWADANGVDAGACVAAAVLRPARREVWTAWVGDSAGFLCRGGGERAGEGDSFECVALTTCHDLSNMEEQKAVEARGGTIKLGGGNRLRVEGALQITRSIGDRPYRRALSQSPQLRRTALQASDEFIVFGSDGIFEVMKPNDIADFVRQSKSMLDELYALQRRLLRKWEKCGAPLRARAPAPVAGSPMGRAATGAGSPRFQTKRDTTDSPPATAGPRRWSVCMGDDDDEQAAVVPPALQVAFDALTDLSERFDDLREKVEEVEAMTDPGPALDEAVEEAFLGPTYAALASYKVVVDALVGNAFTMKAKGRDNTSVVVAFLDPQLLGDADRRCVELIRRGAA